MTAGLPLMKSVLMAVAKSVLLPFGLPVAMSATDAAIQSVKNYSIITFKWRNGRYNENS